MIKSSLLNGVVYNTTKPAVSILLETERIKEIRIAMRKGQIMREHKTPYPIVIEVFNGKIQFTENKKSHLLETGDLIALEGNIPHDLKAENDSIIRLSLSKSDEIQRVKNLVN